MSGGADQTTPAAATPEDPISFVRQMNARDVAFWKARVDFDTKQVRDAQRSLRGSRAELTRAVAYQEATDAYESAFAAFKANKTRENELRLDLARNQLEALEILNRMQREQKTHAKKPKETTR